MNPTANSSALGPLTSNPLDADTLVALLKARLPQALHTTVDLYVGSGHGAARAAQYLFEVRNEGVLEQHLNLWRRKYAGTRNTARSTEQHPSSTASRFARPAGEELSNMQQRILAACIARLERAVSPEVRPIVQLRIGAYSDDTVAGQLAYAQGLEDFLQENGVRQFEGLITGWAG